MPPASLAKSYGLTCCTPSVRYLEQHEMAEMLGDPLEDRLRPFQHFGLGGASQQSSRRRSVNERMTLPYSES
jgi:hypothetical protein